MPIVKVCTMTACPEIKYEIEKILQQLDSKGLAITKSAKTFRMFSSKTKRLREEGYLYLTTGCAVEVKRGIRHVIQINPDFKFSRINEHSFRIDIK